MCKIDYHVMEESTCAPLSFVTVCHSLSILKPLAQILYAFG